MKLKIVTSTDHRKERSAFGQLPQIFDRADFGTVFRDDRNQVKLWNDFGYVVKNFIKITTFNRLAYSFLRKSKAQRSFENAVMLQNLGFSTPDPVAYIEVKRWGILRESYYICNLCRWNSFAETCRVGTDLDERLIDDYAHYIARLHRSGILHHDLNPSNLFYQMDPETHHHKFSVIDLNRMQFKQSLTTRQRLRNLSRVTDDERLFLKIASRYEHLMQDSSHWGLLRTVLYKLVFAERRRLKRTLKEYLKNNQFK